MSKYLKIEKFAATDLTELRRDLQQSGLDSWQAAELVSAFLSGKGYGVASDELRTAATCLEFFTCSIQNIQEELEKVAMFM